MPAASLLVRIAGDFSSMDRELSRAVAKIRKVSAEVSQVGAALSVGVSAPLIGFGAAALRSAGDIEALKLGLAAVTKSASEAERQFVQLREVAKLPGLGLPEAIRGATNLQAVGFSAAKSREILLQFGNALASVGRGRADLEEVVRQLGQLSSRGKVTADNLKPILERVPQIASITKQIYGTIDTEALQKAGVDSQQFIDRILGELGKLERVQGGINNTFENLKDTVNVSLSKVGNALAPLAKRIVDDFIVPAAEKLGDLGRAFAGLPAPVQNVALAFGGLAAAAGPVIFAVGQLSNSYLSLVSLTQTLGITTVGAAATFGAWGVLITGLVASVGYLGAGLLSLARAQGIAAQGIGQFNVISDQLVAKLRATGVNVDDLVAKFERGEIDRSEFSRGLRRLAIEHAPKVAQEVKKVAAEVPNLTASFESAGVVLKAFNHAATSHTVESLKLYEIARRLSGEYTEQVRLLADMTLNTWRNVDALKGFESELAKVDESIRSKNPFAAFTDTDLTAVLKQFEADMKRVAAVADPTLDARVNAEVNRQRGKRGVRFSTIGIRDDVKNQARAIVENSRQISTIVNDLSNGIANAILKAESFGKAMSNAFASIGKALLRAAIEQQIKNITTSIVALTTKHLPSLSGALGKVFGGGGSAGGGAASAAGSAASSGIGAATSSAGNAVGGVAGAAGQIGAGIASGGATAIVGAVAGVVTAVSSVISNFQFHAMNKSLDLIVNHTLRTANQLIEGLQPQVNLYLPKLADIHDRLVQLVNRGGTSGTVNNITINVSGSSNAQKTANEVYRLLIAKGVQFA